MNYYNILGVNEQATKKEIKQNYKNIDIILKVYKIF